MMQKPRAEPINPFYVLLVIVGIAFSLTACAYGMMTVRGARAKTVADGSPPSPLISFLDRHGARLMGGEIALLAATTFAAMALDQRRLRAALPPHPAAASPPSPTRGKGCKKRHPSSLRSQV